MISTSHNLRNIPNIICKPVCTSHLNYLNCRIFGKCSLYCQMWSKCFSRSKSLYFYFVIRKSKMQHIIIPTVKASIKFYYWCNLTSFKLYKQNVNFHYNSAFCEVRSDIQMRFFQYFRLFIIAMCLLVMLAMKEARQTQILTGEL